MRRETAVFVQSAKLIKTPLVWGMETRGDEKKQFQ